MRKARVLALLLATASLGGCGITVSVPIKSSEREALTTSLEQVFPALEADKVALWQWQPCRALETPEGEFRDPDPGLTCGPYVFDGEPKAFDDHANAVFDRVSQAFKAANAQPPRYGWFYYGGDRLARAIFWYGLADTDTCMQQSLMWDAGTIEPSDGDQPGETTVPIGDHWEYHEGECD
jgi:hypothetical protein